MIDFQNKKQAILNTDVSTSNIDIATEWPVLIFLPNKLYNGSIDNAIIIWIRSLDTSFYVRRSIL